MRGKLHLALGIAGGTAGALALAVGEEKAAGLLLPGQTFSIYEGCLFAIGSAVGSLFPDIDLPSSTIGKSVKPLSLIINRLFGHRGLFHAPLLYLLAASALISGIKGSIWFALVLGFFYGITLHLLQDMMTRDGIPFFYPVTKKISLSRMKTGDFANIPATAVLFVLFCLLWRLP